MTSKNFIQLLESNMEPNSALSALRNSLTTLNAMKKKRWQIVSDDHVWMYPADVSLSTVELDSRVYKDTPYETCVFFANGDSEVLKRYETKYDAYRGHKKFEEKYGLKRIKLDDFNV